MYEKLRLKPYSNSLTGTWTKANGDRFFSDPVAGLFIITDGGADAFAGEASIDILRDYVTERVSPDTLPSDETINSLFSEGNERILEMHQAACFESYPVISVTLAIVRGQEHCIVHLGNSRAYLSRNGLLMQVTKDHTKAFERFRNGELLKEDLLTRSGEFE